jgi:hypothetical protein
MFVVLTCLIILIGSILATEVYFYFYKTRRFDAMCRRHVVSTLDDLPSPVSSFFRALLVKRIPFQLEDVVSSDESYGLALIHIRELNYTYLDFKDFLHLCGASILGAYYIFPHFLGQRLLSALSTKSHFPLT